MSDKVTKQVDIHVGAPGAEKVPGLFEKIGHSLHEMNNEARRGPLHGVETILRGAGAGAGILAAAEAVKKLTEAWEGYASGQKKANEALDDFLKEIPLFGQVYDATHGVLGILTGSTAREAEAQRAEGIARSIEEARKASNETFGEIIKKRYAETHPEATSHLAGLLKEGRAIGAQIADQTKSDQRARAMGISPNVARFFSPEEGGVDPAILARAQKENWDSIIKDIAAAGEQFGENFVKSVSGFGKAGSFIFDEFGKALNEQRLNALDAEIQKEQRLAQFKIDQEEAQAARDEEYNKKISAFTYRGSAPTVESQFLRGVGAAAGQRGDTGSDIKATAKSSKSIEKNTGDTADAIKDLARAIRQNPNAITVGIGL